jgi:hypothetical protein
MISFPDNTSAAIATVDWVSLTHDFGEIKLNKPATATFEFTNNGNEPVAIIVVKASCGCTVTDYSKEPVLPKKSSTVSATYNSKRKGFFQKSVTVTMNDNQQYRLTLKGTVVEE